MDCKAVREKFSLYLDGQLSISDIKLVDEHTKVCPTCREELSSLEQTVELVRSLGPVEVPPDLKDKILERVAATSASPAATRAPVVTIRWQRVWRRWGRSLSAVAAILVAAVLIGKAVIGPGFGLKQAAPVAEAPQYAGAGPEMMSFMTEKQDEAAPRLMQQDVKKLEGTGEIGDRGRTEANTAALPLERKVIQTAHLTLQIEKLDVAVDQLQQLVQEYQGFIQNSNMFRQDSGRGAYYTVRIPVNRLTDAVTRLEKLGDVQEKGTTGQDVTEEYVDADARRRNLIRQEERLLAILDQAKTVEDILKVEGQLERVRGEIEALTGRLRYLDNQVELSTINVELRERPHSVTVVQLSDEQGLGARLNRALTSSINLLLCLVSNAVVWVVAALPFLVVAGSVVALVWWLWRRYRK